MENGILHIAIYIAFGILLLALVLSVVRIIKGPDSEDRIVALDLVASIVIGFILLFGILIGRGIYLDIAIAISLVSFMGTVAISIYLREKG